MPSAKTIAITFAIALAAIYVANKVPAIRSIVS